MTERKMQRSRSILMDGIIISFLIRATAVSAMLSHDDWNCSLNGFLPFTFAGTTGCEDCLSVGFSHFAAALMAIEHFNTRNPAVVSDLDKILEGCPVQFDLNRSRFFNADLTNHDAIQSLLQSGEVPCAAVGPFDDNPAIELSTLAAGLNFPLVVHRAFSLRVLTDYASPNTAQVYPDLITSAQHAVDLLVRKGRTNYIAFLYSLTDTGTHWHEAVSVILDLGRMSHLSFSYNSPWSPASGDSTRDVSETLRRVKQSGYRTILVAPEDPIEEIPGMAKAAVELGLTNGDYLWVFVGNVDPNLWISTDPNVIALLRGALQLLPYEAIWLEEYPFNQAWRSQGPDAVQRLRDFNPIQKSNDPLVQTEQGFSFQHKGGYYYPDDDFFNKSFPVFCSGFMYDAVMSAGIGACNALATAVNQSISIDGFVKGIRDSEFNGASYHTRYGCEECAFEGGRTPGTAIWGLFNLYPPNKEIENNVYQIYLTEIIIVEEDRVEIIDETYYADGRTVPPDLLRDVPEQNYLSRGLQHFGFSLMGITITLSIISFAWVYINRDHRVLKASQPYFLYLVCVGAGMSVSSIFGISFDESSGWSKKQLSRACMITPWLFSVGYILLYGALFGKLWRINQVLQSTRRKIDISQVAWPSGVLVVIALILLTVWSAISPLEWHRKELDTDTGESIGSCDSDLMEAFVVPLGLVMLVPTVLTGFMAWKTRDVDEAYSESHYIFIMILVQLEVVLFAVPLLALLHDISTDGRYVGHALILWTFPMSALLFIIGPKVQAYIQHKRGTTRHIRGSTGGVRVTGIQVTSSTANAAVSSNLSRFSHSSNPDHYQQGQPIVDISETTDAKSSKKHKVTESPICED